MVVVLDTNVFVSALLGPRGASREILRACLRGSLEPLMGAALFAEYESLVGRDEIFHGGALSAGEREVILDALLSRCRWVKVYYLWRPNLPDEADNHLIELAVAGAAETIVTKNVRHLRRGELRFPSLRILRPEELWQEIQP